MDPNELLLSLLAAQAHDEVIATAMVDATLGLTGEVGPAGFGATTLEGHLVVFTHPEFYSVAGLPSGLEAVEATARQAAEYAQAVGLIGFVVNPGTHQRFIPIHLWKDDTPAPEPAAIPVLAPLRDVPAALAGAIVEAAEISGVEAVWLADGPAVATRPHPDPAFEAGLLARDIRLPSFGASLWWDPIYAREGTATARAAFRSLSSPIDPALETDLRSSAARNGLAELWAFEATFEGQPSGLALAYLPHPHDAFAKDYDTLHTRHAVGEQTVPLLSAETLREVLPKIGTRLV